MPKKEAGNVKLQDRSRARRYNWNELFDGDVWRLVKDEDYENAKQFLATARSAANRHGGRLAYDDSDPKMIRIQFHATANNDEGGNGKGNGKDK